jgi:hypothetical protein
MGTATAPTQNTADMRNQGIELTLGWRDKVGSVNYSVSGNVSVNNNKVTNYLGSLKQGWVDGVWQTNLGDVSTTTSKNSTDNNQRVLEGHPYGEYFLRTPYKGNGSYFNADGSVNPNGGPKDGMIRTADDMNWLQAMFNATGADGKALYSFNGQKINKANGLWYGEYIMDYRIGDGNYGNTADREFTGKSDIPKYNFGFTASAEWHGFDVNMTWAGNAGMWYYLQERGLNRNNINDSDNLPDDAASKFYYLATDADGNPDWSNAANNLTASYPRLRYSSSGTVANTRYLYNASFFKLKAAQIGYTFPKAWMQKASINNLRIYLSGENLLTFTNYPGVDPEMGSAVNVYPISRLLSVGINLGF